MVIGCVIWQDLDLHCTGPTGSHIFWNDKKGKCGGHLDVDMNASDRHVTGCPVENIFWEHPPKGKYRLWVENNTARNDGSTPFQVRLTKDGKAQDKKFDDIEEYEEIDIFECKRQPCSFPGARASLSLCLCLSFKSLTTRRVRCCLCLCSHCLSAQQGLDRLIITRIRARSNPFPPEEAVVACCVSSHE